MARKTGPISRRMQLAGEWLAAQVLYGGLSLLRRQKPERALRFADRIGRRIGPLIGRHAIVMDNLQLAFPEKSAAERKAIAKAMWGHMARLIVEYPLLYELWAPDRLQAPDSRFEVRGRDHLAVVRETGRPVIFFTAHLGNFEFLPLLATALGLQTTSLYRPPNNKFYARMLERTRSGNVGGALVSSRADAARTLIRRLREKRSVGILVDQKFHRGLVADFFGMPATINPLPGRLSHIGEPLIIPTLCLRRRGGRYSLQIFPPIEPPCRADGTIDEDAVALILTRIVESWVRAVPEQWMWLHNRWQMDPHSRPVAPEISEEHIAELVATAKPHLPDDLIRRS